MQLSQSLLDQVLTLANEAGKHLARFYQQDVAIQTKSDNTPVTAADLFVSQFLIEKLTALFPDIPVLSEENCNIPFEQRQTWQTYWLIDPLDGTQQFIDRTDQFSVLITLVQNHQPVLGVIHLPILNTTYYAMKGFGAFKQSDKEIKALQPQKNRSHEAVKNRRRRHHFTRKSAVNFSKEFGMRIYGGGFEQFEKRFGC